MCAVLTQQKRSTESPIKRTVVLSLQQTWVLTPVLYGWRDNFTNSAKFQVHGREDARGGAKSKSDPYRDPQLFLVFFLGKPVLSLGFFSFSEG